MADLVDYEWLTGSAAASLLEEYSSADEPVHRLLAKLRKILSAEQARQIVQQVELRRRGIAKFGDLANRMFFGDIALQQATDLTTARYKASRVSEGVAVADYCCGIGGDLLAFAERGPATGWDWSAELAHLANANLLAAGLSNRSRVCVGDVAKQTPATNEVWHLDPDRRVDGRRSTQLQWHSPGPELIDRWLKTNPDGIVKLAPATAVPRAWSEIAECEWVTQNRQCRQQITWFGALASARGKHTATVLKADPVPPLLETPNRRESLHRKTLLGRTVRSSGAFASFSGKPSLSAPIATKVARFVYDTDPSLRAARLTGALATELSLHALKNGATYLTSEDALEHPLLTRFEVLEQLPLRVTTLGKHLRCLDIGKLEIKKRGVETDPEQLRKKLKLTGNGSATLLLTRLGNSEIALLAKRDR